MRCSPFPSSSLSLRAHLFGLGSSFPPPDLSYFGAFVFLAASHITGFFFSLLFSFSFSFSLSLSFSFSCSLVRSLVLSLYLALSLSPSRSLTPVVTAWVTH